MFAKRWWCRSASFVCVWVSILVASLAVPLVVVVGDAAGVRPGRGGGPRPRMLLVTLGNFSPGRGTLVPWLLRAPRHGNVTASDTLVPELARDDAAASVAPLPTAPTATAAPLPASPRALPVAELPPLLPPLPPPLPPSTATSSSSLSVLAAPPPPTLPPPPSAPPATTGASPPDIGDEDAVDAVYTWVNGSDPVWAAVAAPVFAAAGLVEHDVRKLTFADAMAHKFRDWNELLYSMRSIYAYAPWVRTIYVVTSGPTQVPAWLNVSHPRVRVVHHAALFDDPATQLPTFNSYAIESVLHRIPGLSNRFLYFNQDFLLAQPVTLATWLQPAISPSFFARLVRPPRSTYLSYFDGANVLSARCRAAMAAAVADAREVNSDGFVACRNGGLFWNAYLTRTVFGAQLFTAFPHVPHLWERRIMYAVEAALGERLLACRRNKLRDSRSDVNIHVQYEAWRVAHQTDPGEPTVRRLSGTHAAAALRTMAPRSSLWLFNILLPSRHVKYYGELATIMADPRRRPTFLTIDDHLVAPRADVLAFNRERIAAFYETHWPESIAAPWEVAAEVPHPVIDPARFVASPPPIPTPSATRSPVRYAAQLRYAGAARAQWPPQFKRWR